MPVSPLIDWLLEGNAVSLRISFANNPLHQTRKLAAAIAALPFHLSYRLLFPEAMRTERQYVRTIAHIGGGCSDKALLLHTILVSAGIEAEYVLGGFGASAALSSDALAAFIANGPIHETLPHIRHVAVTARLDGQWYLVEATGGRVGHGVFDPTTTRALLSHHAALRCPNVHIPMFYHRFDQPIVLSVLANKQNNPLLVQDIIGRVGIAIAGRYAIYVTPNSSSDYISKSAMFASCLVSHYANDQVFTETEASRLLPEDTLNFLLASRAHIEARTGNTPHVYRLYTAPVSWGGERVNDDITTQ